jgi:hypothetical protein
VKSDLRKPPFLYKITKKLDTLNDWRSFKCQVRITRLLNFTHSATTNCEKRSRVRPRVYACRREFTDVELYPVSHCIKNILTSWERGTYPLHPGVRHCGRTPGSISGRPDFKHPYGGHCLFVSIRFIPQPSTRGDRSVVPADNVIH